MFLSATFIAPYPFPYAPRLSSCPPNAHPTCHHPPDTSSKPRILVLPGMDGAELMLTPFRTTLSSPNDPTRVTGITYPPHTPLSVSALAAHVTETYLTPLASDSRGYILVHQSFSGHVGFHLALNPPENLLAQVFVNAFASPPGPSFLHDGRFRLPEFFFKYQPPAWMVSDIFLGPEAQGMQTVQAAGAAVSPSVMRQRLDLCLGENSWHIWRRADLVPASKTLFLRGDADRIISPAQANQMRRARADIPWVTIPNGPHLLLQRLGITSALAIETFCDEIISRRGSPAASV